MSNISHINSDYSVSVCLSHTHSHMHMYSHTDMHVHTKNTIQFPQGTVSLSHMLLRILGEWRAVDRGTGPWGQDSNFSQGPYPSTKALPILKHTCLISGLHPGSGNVKWHFLSVKELKKRKSVVSERMQNALVSNFPRHGKYSFSSLRLSWLLQV